MSDDWRTADRDEPVGDPVVRSDPAVTGDHAERAVEFDPDDPASVAEAAATVRRFAAGELDTESVHLLRGAAACAALVRGVGSYTAAARRAGDEVTVEFVRKWARVHDLPQSVRRHVARGDIAPTAAKHVARLEGSARLVLAWTTIDADLTVREVRHATSAVADGTPLFDALADVGADPGRITLRLPLDEYVDLRRRASLTDAAPGDVVADALVGHFDDGPDD